MYEPYSDLCDIRLQSLLINEVCHRWGSVADDELLASRTSLATWRVARVATAWLGKQPSVILGRRWKPLGGVILLIEAVLTGLIVQSHSTQRSWLSRRMQRLDERIASVRSLSLSTEVNDMLARHQRDVHDIHILLRDDRLFEMSARSAVHH